MLSHIKNRRGFTIVEVMIVLAIAGVMMSVVFLAVPQLQRNSRDSQRQATLESIHTEIENYAANNTGKYPLNYDPAHSQTCGSTVNGDFADFYCNYIFNGTIHYKDDNDPTLKTSIFLNATTTDPSKYRPQQCGSASGVCTAARPNKGQAQIVLHAKCSGSNAVTADGITSGTSTRSYAMVIGLERDGTYFCVDNS